MCSNVRDWSGPRRLPTDMPVPGISAIRERGYVSNYWARREAARIRRGSGARAGRVHLSRQNAEQCLARHVCPGEDDDHTLGLSESVRYLPEACHGDGGRSLDQNQLALDDFAQTLDDFLFRHREEFVDPIAAKIKRDRALLQPSGRAVRERW